MSAHEKRQNGLAVFLHIYTMETYIREKLLFFPGERRKLYLPAERLGTSGPMELMLEREDGIWKLDGRRAAESSFYSLKTQTGEEAAVVLSGGKERLCPCKRVIPGSRSQISVGSAYRNEVFYECLSFSRSRQILIRHREEGYLLETCIPERERKISGLYVNGRAVRGRVLLNEGDCVQLWGLSMLCLEEFLICSAFYGTLRTAEGKEDVSSLDRPQKENIPCPQLTRSVREEAELHAGELELDMPQNIRPQWEGPLLLSLGPSMTMVLPALLMAALGGALLGERGGGYYRISMVMTAFTALLGVFWGMVNHVYKKKAGVREIIRNKEIYREYLAKTGQYLSQCLAENQEALGKKYPSCQRILEGAGSVFWNCSAFQKDYLFVRLGLGERPFPIQIKHSGKNRELNQDSLVQEAYRLADAFLTMPSVPVGIDLEQAGSVGFAGEGIYSVLLQALVQLAASHSSRSMRIAFFYDRQKEADRDFAACLKWLPHIWSRGRRVRYLAGDEREAGEILPELKRELAGQEGEKERPFYLLIAASPELAEGAGTEIFGSGVKGGSGIYSIFVHREREYLPGQCRGFVIREQGREEIVLYGQDEVKRQSLSLEECGFMEAEAYMRKMAGLFPKGGEREDALADKVSFLELYSCRRVQELNCFGRWSRGRTGESMRVPVGKGRGGKLICLDIHEKFHGPHGLIAGTTGSGKSELLQTYLLSLAVSFGPEDVNFFIIDYKGGSVGNALRRLPHCAGVISNLSGGQIRRALISIKSENRRRQRLFGHFGVSHVEDYMELYRQGGAAEPVPHLLLVVDEFAELKKEEPEFMQEIISVAQVGRSLGVHLILSTQKPAGTVDDKIWSNTRFRLCLRVAERQDSMDMLHRPQAAALTKAGQCYMQVGNDEVCELFQAGYAGGGYEDAGKKEAAFLVLGTGKRIAGKKESGKKGPSEMEAVIGYIAETAKQTESERARTLWMPELAQRLVLGEICMGDARKEEEIRLCLGLCDDPEQQRQYPLFYRPLEEGNLLIGGGPSTGKSTLLQTMLWQMCGEYSPRQIQILLAGADNAGVGCFENMPHCLGSMRQSRQAQCFFYHLERLFEERKERLRGINFQQFRKHAAEEAGYVFLVIDNYGSFRETTQDKYEALIGRLAGEGINYGIYLILTVQGTGSGEIPGKLFEKMKTTLCLEMSDRFQYGDILRRYQMTVCPRENVKGRGLCRDGERILEFQSPVFGTGDDYQRIDRVKELAGKRSASLAGAGIPARFPSLPEKPLYAAMAEKAFEKTGKKEEIPIGYVERSGYIKTISFRKGSFFLISGAERTGKRNLLLCMIRGLWQLGIHVLVLDRKHGFRERVLLAAQRANQKERLLLCEDETAFADWYERCIQTQKEGAGESKWCLCLCDLSDFAGMLCANRERMQRIRDSFECKAQEESLMPVIALQRPGRETELLGTFVFALFAQGQQGVHLGGNAGNQRILSFEDLGFEEMSRGLEKGGGYLKMGDAERTERIRIPLYDDIG